MGETIEIPDLLPYPEVLPFAEVPMLHNQFVYVVEKYPFNGFSILIVRSKGHIVIRVADFKGNLVDPTTNDQMGMIVNYSVSVIKHVALDKYPPS